jgi:polyisoprenoid-binding protein YceI
MQMKTTATTMLLALAVCTLFSCKQAPKADKAQTSDAKEVTQTDTKASGVLQINTDQSTVTWVGTKPTGQHNGTIKLQSGVLRVNGSDVVGGNFIMDITTLAVLDMDDENNGKLGGHLKSPDFFDTAKHPTAAFAITGVTPFDAATAKEKPLLAGATHTVAGNLTLKGVTKNVTFPAIIKTNGSTLAAKANFNIDRTLWGLNYGNDQSLGDKFIRPTVNVGFNIVSK